MSLRNVYIRLADNESKSWLLELELSDKENETKEIKNQHHVSIPISQPKKILSEEIIIEENLQYCINGLKDRQKSLRRIRNGFCSVNLLITLFSMTYAIVASYLYYENLYAYPDSCPALECWPWYDACYDIDNKCDNFPFTCPDLIGILQDNADSLNGRYPLCVNSILNMLAGPGMWKGFLYVIIIFGVFTPLVLSCLVPCFFVNKTAILSHERLSDGLRLVLEENSRQYNIHLDRNDITVTLSNFEKKLAEVQNNRPTRLAFVMGAREEKSPVSLLFNHPNLRAPQLCHEIFSMLGIPAKPDKRLIKKALFDATKSKNAAIPLHRFFKKLAKDEVKRKFVLENIYAFAGLKIKNRD